MSVGIEPMGEMVLLEMENAPEKTESGLLLPEEAREKMNVGKVVATDQMSRASAQETESFIVSTVAPRSNGWGLNTC